MRGKRAAVYNKNSVYAVVFGAGIKRAAFYIGIVS
jgi:hypothetical protein